MTTWPQNRLPLPQTPLGFPFSYDADADAFVPDWEAAKERADTPLPPSSETYLKLAALDPDDISAVTTFLCEHGELDVRGRMWGRNAFWSAIELGPSQGAELLMALERAAEVRGINGVSDTLTEVRWAVLYMRDLIACWRVLQEGLDRATHRWEAPCWAGMRDLDSPPWTMEGPVAALSWALNEGLAPFSPHVRTFYEGAPPDDLWADGIGTWNLCCLQLFNHIAENARYRVCNNEACQRLFVRQEGRAVHRQHRTSGVKYCSAACARSQASRAYRRRKAERPE